ncbi:MAG: C39 family peptidase [Patescibacteria group bacterium]
MKRIGQKTAVHCGPATIEMLLSYLGKKINQKKISENAGVGVHWFKKYGLTVDNLKTAVNKLFPDLIFWSKENSTIRELSDIVNIKKLPVGIEWQGVFDYEEGDFDPKYGVEDDDPGHYSVVTGIDIKKGIIIIADPERHYVGRDRKFKIDFFKKRWWDVNEIKSKKTRKTRKKIDKRPMFLITK